MQLKPVKRYSEPTYPINTILEEHPELLYAVPERWRGNKAVIAALTGLCLLSASYHAQATKNVKSTPTRIAPVFQHGDGRGSFGCEAINPPVVLSEAEARQVIIEEAKRSGIVFNQKDVELPSVKIQLEVDMSLYPEGKTEVLKLDGKDTKRNIGFEYVSMDDTELWQAASNGTAHTVEPLKAAKLLRKQLATGKPRGTYGVFYDPFVRPKSADSRNQNVTEISEYDASKASKEELRAQVRDFIKWLKVEGVI